MGHCSDDSIAESFFATLECELPEQRPMVRNRTQAKIAAFDFTGGFYNTHRRHSSGGNGGPARFEADRQTPPA